MKYLHTMVRVSDLDASLDFYCNKLGLLELRRIDVDDVSGPVELRPVLGAWVSGRLLPPPGKDWCDCLEFFEERAGIREVDGGEDRQAAESKSCVEAFLDGD